MSSDGFSLNASVKISNTGNTAGSEVVQLYLSLPKTSDLSHPLLQLRAFAKVKNLQPGKHEQVDLKLDKYAVSYWEERIDRWVVEKGEYEVYVGPSSQQLPLRKAFTVEKGFEWSGL